MNKEDIQSRRADNQIWNSEQSYGKTPEFAAYDDDGDAELYMNTVIGLAYRLYDFNKFKPLFNSFQTQPNGELYSELFWLGLEGLAYRRGREERPVLDELRCEYAHKFDNISSADSHSIENLRAAWFHRAFGISPGEDEWVKSVLDALTFSPELTEEQIAAQMEAILYRYFRRARRSLTDRQWAAWVDRSFNGKKKNSGRIVGRDAMRRLAMTDAAEEGSTLGKAQKVFQLLQGRTPEPVLRRYVEDVFGKSMLTPAELAKAERELCTGIHKNCRLHFTRGVKCEREMSHETLWDLKCFDEQHKKNREYYDSHLVQNRLIISQLTQKLQNTILLRQDTDDSLSRAGVISSPRAWRAAALDDEKIFERRVRCDPSNLSVDILLDGSASQNTQQEKLSTQAYIIAESLGRCLIPTRVTSFCSVSGCTVMQILRDYNEFNKNDLIFNYTACGWNRDGLAMRAMGWLMRHTNSDNRLLIILSDANPNDDEKIPNTGIIPGGKIYGGKRGIDDARTETAALRISGIHPYCVFTGSDAELPGAREIYGRNLTRIPSIGWFADTVAKLIQGQIAATENIGG